MNDPLDLDALAREWKEIDMKPVQMALDTGRLRSSYTAGFVLMAGIAGMLTVTLTAWPFFAPVPEPALRLAVGACIGTLLAIFLAFFRRQWLAVRRADALLTGTPVELVRGRQALLEVELHAWTGLAARFSEFWLAPGAVVISGVFALEGLMPWAVPVLAAAFVLGFSLYGRLSRVPALTREIADLDALATSLEA